MKQRYDLAADRTPGVSQAVFHLAQGFIRLTLLSVTGVEVHGCLKVHVWTTDGASWMVVWVDPKHITRTNRTHKRTLLRRCSTQYTEPRAQGEQKIVAWHGAAGLVLGTTALCMHVKDQ